MTNKYPKKRYWFIPLIIFLLVFMSGCTQQEPHKLAKPPWLVAQEKSGDVITPPVEKEHGIVTPSANLTSPAIQPAEENLVNEKEAQTQSTGKGWIKTYGERGIGGLSFYPIQQTTDGGYIAVGYREDFTIADNGQINGGGRRIYLLKIDANGNVQWDKTYEKRDNIGISVEQTSDGGYIIGGGGPSYLTKTDANGNLIWEKVNPLPEKHYDMTGMYIGYEKPSSIQQTSDGGYIAGGLALRPFGPDEGCSGQECIKEDPFLLKVTADGNSVWEKIIKLSWFDSVKLVSQTSDGGYLAVIYTNAFGVKDELYLVKVDANGNDEWKKQFGEYYNIINIGNESIYVGGSGGKQMFKLDENGNKLEERTFELPKLPAQLVDDIISATPTSDGGYVVIATKGSNRDLIKNFYILKFDKNKTMTRYNNIGFDIYENSSGGPMIRQSLNGGYIISGMKSFFASPETYYQEFSYYLIKTDENGNI